MASGDVIFNNAISIIEAGGPPTWIPQTGESQWAKEEFQPIFYYFDGSSWDRFDLDFANGNFTGSILNNSTPSAAAQFQALSDAIEAIANDGNATNVVRANATEDVEPTAAEVPNPENGDTAHVSLSSQKVEYWSYTGGAWSKAFVIDYSAVSIPIQTVADTNSIDLEISGTELTATLSLDPTQDNEFQITESANGVRITKQTLTAYASFSAAQADAGLAVGNAFVLTINNLNGVPSDGVTGPVFRKQ